MSTASAQSPDPSLPPESSSAPSQQVVGQGRNVADDEDLAGGTRVSLAVAGGANVFVQQIRAIQTLRLTVTIVASIVLAALIVALGVTVWSFTKQIDKATPDLNFKQLSKAAPARVEAKPSGPLAGTSPPAQTPVTTVSPIIPPSVSVSVDISSIGNSVVAVVSVLVLAISILAIALLRATFSLSALGENSSSSPEPAKKIDNSISPPTVEALKATYEALNTVIKALLGKKD